MSRLRSLGLAAMMLAPLLAGCSDEEPAAAVANASELPPGAIRVATFNTSLHRTGAGVLIDDLSDGSDPQAKATAQIIQRVRPDIVLLNEVDYDPDGEALRLLQQNYLSKSQYGKDPVEYGYSYAVPTNTGLDSGFDLDNDGELGGPGDAYGFGEYEGQFGFVVLSRYPIDRDQMRSFQTFLWNDMPDAAWPEDWYDDDEQQGVRLSSKNHVDVPIDVAGTTVHLLAHHPTPPAFDGPEDRNGIRNEAEIRLWADYLSDADYLYDDDGNSGGLAEGERFVLVGDHNADPADGSSRPGAMNQLLEHPRVNTELTPSSRGAVYASEHQGGVNESQISDPAHDTGDFGDDYVGNLRLDYALPSVEMEIIDAQVFWPRPWESGYSLIKHSDHRMVWVDLQVY